MKTYTVKEIAKMLKTNPETVRRWIRSGKLAAVHDSRKGGNIITEKSLTRFLDSAPKYAEMLGILGLSSLIAGMPELSASFLVVSQIQEELVEAAISNSRVPAYEIKKLIESKIKESRKNISKKKEAIAHIQEEIANEESTITKYKQLLSAIDNYEKERNNNE